MTADDEESESSTTVKESESEYSTADEESESLQNSLPELHELFVEIGGESGIDCDWGGSGIAKLVWPTVKEVSADNFLFI